jgi:mevalonate kinase
MEAAVSQKVFFGKLMLFGEYGVMLGSPALTVPLKMFKAKWAAAAAGSEKASQSNATLVGFLSYLKKQENLSGILALDVFETELENGLHFESTIPNAYGAGSSGALVAATYDRYCAKPLRELLQLKSVLGLMESHFHGQSSGIDPLSCYLGKPLLIHDQSAETIQDPLTADVPVAFLIDTHNTGETSALVQTFKTKLLQYSFYKKLKNLFLPQTTACINALIAHEPAHFFESLAALSQFQLSQMPEMIPEAYRPLWQKGLDTGDFTLKLCGSGGGGFILGFGRDLASVRDHPGEMIWL